MGLGLHAQPRSQGIGRTGSCCCTLQPRQTAGAAPEVSVRLLLARRTDPRFQLTCIGPTPCPGLKVWPEDIETINAKAPEAINLEGF